MRKLYIILMLLVLAGVNAVAQTSEAQFRFYKSGSNTYSYIPVMCVDSLAFVPEAFDVYVSSKAILTAEGEWGLKVNVGAAFSVEKLKITVVPVSYTEEEILSAYEKGTLSDLRTLADSVYTEEFILEDGTYKPVVFGLDKEGQMRSHAIGTEVNISGAYQTAVLSPLVYGQHINADDWGYGSIMRIRDVMGEEMTMNMDSAYDWYSTWESNDGVGSGFRPVQVVWLYFDNAIRMCTETIQALDVPGVQNNPMAKIFLGTAIAMRAMHYLDAARMYEYLPTDGTSSVNESGNDVMNLTYPIGSASEFRADETRKPTRVTAQEMAAYIEEELNRAEELLWGAEVADKEMVSTAVVYGLKARLYMWAGNYAAARDNADKAINGSNCQMLTEAEWHDALRGFNDCSVSSWMWALKYKADNPGVRSGLVNWVSWNSNQTNVSYIGNQLGQYTIIGKSVYDRISDTDFRKKSFKAPAGSPLYGQETYLSNYDYSMMPDYTSLKFRPGQGVVDDNTIGAVVDVPLMRVEEMHFIRMEAKAQMGEVAAAVADLSEFISTHRDPRYEFAPATTEEVIDEIFNHKRIEFWGEGLNYFDYKRLNKPVTRNYEGTNVPERYRFNTTTRPAWMNFVFVKNAYDGKLQDWNNPDPSGCYENQ